MFTDGVELPRHTLCRWADITADSLAPSANSPNTNSSCKPSYKPTKPSLIRDSGRRAPVLHPVPLSIEKTLLALQRQVLPSNPVGEAVAYYRTL